MIYFIALPPVHAYSLTSDDLKLDVYVESYSVLFGCWCKMNPCWWHIISGFFIHFTIGGCNVAMNILVHSPSVNRKVFPLAGKISTCKTWLANGRLLSRVAVPCFIPISSVQVTWHCLHLIISGLLIFANLEGMY